MSRLFGTDGVRGVANHELTVELTLNLARAAAVVLTKNGSNKKSVVIGKDTRLSSDVLESALAAGFTSVGMDVILLGVLPTPAVSYLVKENNAACGVMISASHNPFYDNGIKFFSDEGLKLPDSVEDEIEKLINTQTLSSYVKTHENIGRIYRKETEVEKYVSKIAATAESSFTGLKALIDCSNGSASKIAEKLFNKLGLNTEVINNNPDGLNINKDCGSTHIELLAEKVRSGNYDIGIAFDGDADRCLAVDEKGNIIDGDKIIALLSTHMKKKGTLKKDTAVVTVMSNLGFHNFMKENGLKTTCTAVGDRYVLEEMQKNGYNIGGEQSGHIIFLDYMSTGDGMLTAVQLLSMLSTSQEKLSVMAAGIPDYPQTLTGIKVTAEEKESYKNSEKIKSAISECEKDFGNDGRVLVRASGTEPLIRVMIEGKNKEKVDYWTAKLCEDIRNYL